MACPQVLIPSMQSFSEGVRRNRPAWKCLVPSWDLQVSLFCLPPFEPFASLDLQLLCCKNAYFMTVVSANWVSKLVLLTAGTLCLRFGEGDTSSTTSI